VAVSFIGGGNQNNRRKPLTCRISHWQTYHIMLYRVHPAWVGFKLTTLVVISTDCIGSCKSNYHMITTTTAPMSILSQVKSYEQWWIKIKKSLLCHFPPICCNNMYMLFFHFSRHFSSEWIRKTKSTSFFQMR
jgi:hypothetical protein